MSHSFFYNLPETMKTDIKILPQVKLKKMSVDFYKTFFFFLYHQQNSQNSHCVCCFLQRCLLLTRTSKAPACM